MSTFHAIFGPCKPPPPPRPTVREPAADAPLHVAKPAKRVQKIVEPEVQRALDERIDTIIRLEKTVRALAKDQFRWLSGAAGKDAVPKISKAFVGFVKIHPDTVRAHLHAIAQGGVQARDKPLDPAASAAILKSLRRIALGLAMAKFDWKAGANNEAAEAAILQAMERQGESMDREALHLLLYQAERELRT